MGHDRSQSPEVSTGVPICQTVECRYLGSASLGRSKILTDNKWRYLWDMADRFVDLVSILEGRMVIDCC